MQQNSKNKNLFIKIFAIILFLCGCAFFIYPYATRWYAAYQSDKVMDTFEEDLERMKNLLNNQKNDSQTANSDVGSDSENEELNQLNKLYEDLCNYNKRLYEEGQKDLKDPFSYEVHSIDLTEYGFKNNVIGIISISKINVEMPMYLGANKNNMTKGVAVMGETSMPTGGINNNVVVAAHRGYKGIKMFRDIEELEIGDEIKITTAWEELEYKISEIKIVEKDEIDEVFIREGKDMVTLLTCHPYTENTHRYLVFAERIKVDNDSLEENTTLNDANKEGNNVNDGIANESKDSQNIENQKVQKSFNLKIWLENYLPIIGICVVIFLIIIGIICTSLKNE